MTRGYDPRWDITLRYGEGGERYVYELLHMSPGEHIEVKRKSYIDDHFYFETEQSPRADGTFGPSGLNTTKADHWAFVIADTGVVVIVPTRLLRERFGHALG